ncbi:putative PAS/PAC sensor protein [Hyphomicrobium denitrificans ATCC 51888]|uniref:histidine kinase n=1 Tax=Hyphomicrobium denitrificans (strain ATCC 51888 / DSM 1869 / NCIMB 11706 / TK 0415) TaxID=582899 RepID=D8JTM6_HYPDA|nr:HWE histidine kinase domain-containing protein [Hyphomicrobium denitrificans]ADJ22588.1 putative PAS/PAC sensor protein [Hyphomicrobium denitrificans ATCC 51888]
MSSSDVQVDLTNCDREPIHILGAVQPIGFLFAVTTDWIVARASENISDFIGCRATDMIGHPLAEFLPSRALHDLRNRVSLLRGADSIERLFACELIKDRRFDVAVHISGAYIVIEAEAGNEPPKDITGTVRTMMARLDQTPDFTSFYREGARQVRALLGYDRVMVYKFDPDGSGEVVGEACKSGIGSFKGLHYPASDIPQQARALYRRNLLRIIADVGAVPVRITPELDEFGKPMDLSLSMLRSVSPIHIEYLKNMGVGASLSISIIVDEELWGLFACHHYSPMVPNFQMRSVSELFAQMFAMRLESRERRAIVDYERRARDISDQLLGAVASDETLLKDPDWLADILTNTIPADGVGVWINGSYAFSGITPSTESFRQIVRALNGTAAGKVFATDQITSLISAIDSNGVAGLLAIPISRSPRDYVVLFRSEMVRSVRWAGDPHKPAEYGPNGPRLTPRESFAEWKELVEGRSKPFTSSEMRVAETLRATLIEVVLRLADEAAAERHQASARQELLIAELNHRVRNILGVIRGLIRQSQPDEDAVAKFVQLVDGRIHALARAHNQITDDHWGPAPLQAIVDAESASISAGADRIGGGGPPVLLNPQAYSAMALVVHELVTNSTKYGSLTTNGSVEMTWHRNGARDLVVAWREYGGPRVRPPQRKGFGTTIIERSVPYDLGGSAEARYNETGFEADFIIPARHVSEAKSFAGKAIKFARPSPGHPVEPPPKFLANRSVLLVEDSLIISLDAEDILTRLGADTVITHATTQGALDYLGSETPSIAVLDINLGDRTSFPVADRLQELGVPFIFASGYGEQASLPMEHRARQVLQKPYTIENIARVLVELLETSD